MSAGGTAVPSDHRGACSHSYDESLVRQAGGEGIPGGQDEIVAVVRHHHALIQSRCLEMDRIVLRE